MDVRLPVLENVRIASPCSMPWNQMKGDERVRFCGQCQKNVYNLSAMTRKDAESLLRTHTGSLCVQIYQRADGTVLTADCPVGLRAMRMRMAKRMAWLGACVAAGIAMVANHRFGSGAPVATTVPQVATASPVAQPPRPVQTSCTSEGPEIEQVSVGNERYRVIRGGRSTRQVTPERASLGQDDAEEFHLPVEAEREPTSK